MVSVFVAVKVKHITQHGPMESNACPEKLIQPKPLTIDELPNPAGSKSHPQTAGHQTAVLTDLSGQETHGIYRSTFPNCNFYQFVANVDCVSDKPVKLSPAASVMKAMEISADSQVTQLTTSPQAGMPRSPSIDENSSELFCIVLHAMHCDCMLLMKRSEFPLRHCP